MSMLNMAISSLFYTPKMQYLAARNREVVLEYKLLQSRIRTSQSLIGEIQHRDRNLYRSLFVMEAFAEGDTSTPYHPSKYASLQGDEYSSLMIETWQMMDALMYDIYTASLSLDELQSMAQNKEVMASSMPAIWPIDRPDMRAFYSFGMRDEHPILGASRMHQGVDLATGYGVPVYATGDGVVERSEEGEADKGYGRLIVINHGFGYKTKYAHLQTRLVERGDSVRRGQQIGEVGSSGGSTGPHLHYEVLFKEQNVDPLNYFKFSMTNDEYRNLMESMKRDSDLEQKTILDIGNKEENTGE